MQTATLFKCLSDETRLLCTTLIYRKGEMCVCELVDTLRINQPDISQPKVSRHLAQLRSCGLLLDSRRGQWVYYQLTPDLPDAINNIIRAASDAITDQLDSLIQATPNANCQNG